MQDLIPIHQLEPHLYSEEEYKKMQRIISRMSYGGILILPEEPPTSP